MISFVSEMTRATELPELSRSTEKIGANRVSWQDSCPTGYRQLTRLIRAVRVNESRVSIVKNEYEDAKLTYHTQYLATIFSFVKSPIQLRSFSAVKSDPSS